MLNFLTFEIRAIFIFFYNLEYNSHIKNCLHRYIWKYNSMILMLVYNSEEEHSISSLSSVEDEKKTQQDFANKEKRYLYKSYLLSRSVN